MNDGRKGGHWAREGGERMLGCWACKWFGGGVHFSRLFSPCSPLNDAACQRSLMVDRKSQLTVVINTNRIEDNILILVRWIATQHMDET